MNNPYRIIKEDVDVCILYVYGNGGNVDMGDIVLYNGGYICPKHNDLSQYTSLHSTPVGNDDGDIVFILTVGLIDNDTMADYMEIADDQIILWGNTEMNNWGPRPMITVIAGDIPNQYLTNIVTDYMLDDAIKIEPRVIMVQDKQYVVTDVAETIDINSETVTIAVGALHDHIENVKLDHWAYQNGDYCADKGENLWVNEWNGTYNGPSIRIETIYFTID